MIGLDTLFWALIILFAVIGALRGWGKEVLVTFSAILGLFLINVLETYVPYVRDTLVAENGKYLLFMRIGLMCVLFFFGYQTPNLPRLVGHVRLHRSQFQDSLLGVFLGAINGYLLWGTLWYYLADFGYEIASITAPVEGGAAFEAAQRILPLLPPNFIGTPVIYVAVAIAFAFLLVVFL